MVRSATRLQQADAVLRQGDREDLRLHKQLGEFRRGRALLGDLHKVARACNLASRGHISPINFWFGTHFVARQSAEPPSANPEVDPPRDCACRQIHAKGAPWLAEP